MLRRKIRMVKLLFQILINLNVMILLQKNL
nr:MAG TPA: hypothetical protein [Caudoviricetes sp.]